MKKRLLAFIVVLILLVGVFPASAFAAEGDNGSIALPDYVTIYYITGSNVNLRSGPGTSYSSGGYVQYGDTLDFVYNYNGSFTYQGEGYWWYHVLMTSGENSGNRGYVVSDYVGSRQVGSID